MFQKGPALPSRFFKDAFPSGVFRRSLLNWQLIPSINIHIYNTRAKHNIHTFRAKHKFAMKCLRHSLPHTINETPDAIKNIYTHSLHGFIIYIKTCLLNNNSDMCTLSQCYICQLN